jgi:hypothetical protein
LNPFAHVWCCMIQGHWTPEEDSKLRELVAEGKKNWGQVASLIPGRT